MLAVIFQSDKIISSSIRKKDLITQKICLDRALYRCITFHLEYLHKFHMNFIFQISHLIGFHIYFLYRNDKILDKHSNGFIILNKLDVSFFFKREKKGKKPLLKVKKMNFKMGDILHPQAHQELHPQWVARTCYKHLGYLQDK